MERLPDLSALSHDEKDALIHALWAQVQALTAQIATLTARVGELESRLGVPPKTPDNSSLPPSQGKKPNRDDKPARCGPRQGSLGRQGGGRLLAGWDHWSQPGRDGHRPPDPLRALRGCAGRGRPHARRPLRQDRPADGHPAGDAGRALRRALPLLRRHHAGPAARGAGARHPVQPQHRRAGDVPALRPPRQLPAAQPVAARAVRPRHQRGRARRRVPARQAPPRRRDRDHSGSPAPGAGRRLGRFEALPRTACASTGAAAGTGCSRTTRW
jgi:hypothetical protein